MNYKLLIIPGYLVGIGSLILISYRTFLAFFSESKSVTIHVNRYGEQYADIIFLCIIWFICLLGFVYLYFLLKEESKETKLKSNMHGSKVMSKDGLYLGILKDSLVDEKTGIIRGIIEPSQDIDPHVHQCDDGGNLIVSFDSIKIVRDDT